MEPRYIHSAAKHVRARDLMGTGQTLLLAQLAALGIVMYVECIVHDEFYFILHIHYASSVIASPSIQMEQRHTISAARHVQRVRMVHKESLQLEPTVMVNALFFSSLYYCLRLLFSAVCQAPGCQNPPHSAGNGPGPGYEYCSIAHKTLV